MGTGGGGNRKRVGPTRLLTDPAAAAPPRGRLWRLQPRPPPRARGGCWEARSARDERSARRDLAETRPGRPQEGKGRGPDDPGPRGGTRERGGSGSRGRARWQSSIDRLPAVLPSSEPGKDSAAGSSRPQCREPPGSARSAPKCIGEPRACTSGSKAHFIPVTRGSRTENRTLEGTD